METIDIVMKAVKDSSLLGVTSLEITKATGVKNNRITAALHRLWQVRCIRRDRSVGSTARFRYWYVRDPRPGELRAPQLGEQTKTVLFAGYQPLNKEALLPPPSPVAVRPPAQTSRLNNVELSEIVISLNVLGRAPVGVTVEQARRIYRDLHTIFGD